MPSPTFNTGTFLSWNLHDKKVVYDIGDFHPARNLMVMNVDLGQIFHLHPTNPQWGWHLGIVRDHLYRVRSPSAASNQFCIIPALTTRLSSSLSLLEGAIVLGINHIHNRLQFYSYFHKHNINGPKHARKRFACNFATFLQD